MAADAQGAILGGLRAALQALTDHAHQQADAGTAPGAASQHTIFMAGLVGQVQAVLAQVRDEFCLPDVSTAADVPEWMADEYADDPDAAAAARAQREDGRS